MLKLILLSRHSTAHCYNSILSYRLFSSTTVPLAWVHTPTTALTLLDNFLLLLLQHLHCCTHHYNHHVIECLFELQDLYTENYFNNVCNWHRTPSLLHVSAQLITVPSSNPTKQNIILKLQKPTFHYILQTRQEKLQLHVQSVYQFHLFDIRL